MNKQLPEQTGQKHNATADTVGWQRHNDDKFLRHQWPITCDQ